MHILKLIPPRNHDVAKEWLHSERMMYLVLGFVLGVAMASLMYCAGKF